MPSFELVSVPSNFANVVLKAGGLLTPLLIDSSLTKGTGTTNPSIFVDNGDVMVNVRHVEYTLYHSEKKKYTHPWGPIQYLHGENDMVLKTNNFLGIYDLNRREFNYSKVDTSPLDVPPIWEFVGLEDARIVKWHDKIYLSGVRRDTTPNGQGRMELSEVQYNGSTYVETKRSRIPAPGNDGSYCEKNWMPIIDLPYHYVKWCNPVEVVKVNPDLLICETVFLGSSTINLDHDLRGGSQVLPYGDRHRIAITHQVDLFKSKMGRKDARYLNRFVVWDLDWNIVRVSEPFDFLGADIEFTCGAAWSPKDGALMVTFGYQDNSAFLLEIPKSFLDQTLAMNQTTTPDNMTEQRKPKVIDYFPYFNEEELLELRVRTLEDKVDQFIIAEANATFTGTPKNYTIMETIHRLGLPKDKIRVITINYPDNLYDYLQEIDLVYSGYGYQDPRVLFWIRERLQKDALNSVMDDYEEDDVFIIGDCDEIIRPELIDMYSIHARNYLDKIIRVPMALIEGKADLRVHNLDGSPAPWDMGPVVCTKNHLERFTVSQLRGHYVENIEMVYVTHDGKRIEDAGWHFSWMGGSERSIVKASAFSHAKDTFDMLSFKRFNTMEMVDFMRSYEAKEGAVNPIGDETTVLKKYPLEELPQVLFTLPRVRNYLLPNYERDQEISKLTPIPVIGTALVNGTKWVKRLIDSVDYPVDEFVIFNNNGRGEITSELEEIVHLGSPFIKSIKLCHLPGNIGCPGAWNLIIKSYLTSPYWIIANHDIAFTDGFLKAMVTHAEDPEVGLVHGDPGTRGTGMYDIFLIKDWVVQEFGMFDENFYPAYDEDVDYIIRLLSDPHKTPKRVLSVGVPHLHGESDYATSGSQTWRTESHLKEKLDYARETNESEYMAQKWGPDWQTSPYDCPFGYAPVTMTTFDLNFVRRKHLGF